jgi:hypothetical protein
MTPGERIRALIVGLLGKIRYAIAVLLQVFQRDELARISEQTQQLGSASVESVTYVGGELRALDERLERVESELAALRALLEQRAGSPEGVTSGSSEED